jgi:transcriptional regulator with XRE-family HTH domain
MAGRELDGLGRRVRCARHRLGFSREALAYHASLSWSAVTQIETGRRTNLRPATLAALADALGVSIDYLVTGRGAGRPMLQHDALIYGGSEEFAYRAGRFLAEGLAHSEAALAVSSEPNLRLLRRELGPAAEQVRFEEHSSWLRSPIAVLRALHSFIDQSIDSGAPWVRVVVEPIWAGRSADEVRLWANHESLLNVMFAQAPVTLVCPYDEQALDPQILKVARATHPRACERGEFSESAAYREPSGFVLEG